jgi:hypothetical protein
MRKPEWPGIATSVGIVLIVTIVIAGAEPDFKLKEWQPLMAAIVALAAGAMAYLGAMAKVNYDREQEQRDAEKEKVGLFLRLRHAMQKLENESTEVCDRLGMNVMSSNRKISISQIPMTSREEFDEAWRSLELLPVDLSFWLDLTRTELPRALKRLESIPPEDIIDVPLLGISDSTPLGEYRQTAIKLREASQTIVDTLDKEIIKIRMNMLGMKRE